MAADIGSKPSLGVSSGHGVLFVDGRSLLGARSIALIVEIVGVETRDASALYGVLNAIATIPFLYMIRLDGFGLQ